MSGEQDDFGGLDPEQLSQVTGELLGQEAENQASILGSQADFEVWLHSQPGLRSVVMVENFSEILPAVFNFFRAMLGLEVKDKLGDGEASDENRSA